MSNPGDVIRKYCLPDEPIEDAVNKCVEHMMESFSMDDALKIMDAAIDGMKEHDAETKDWNFIEKTTWLIRAGFCSGFKMATDVMFHAIEMGANEADSAT